MMRVLEEVEDGVVINTFLELNCTDDSSQLVGILKNSREANGPRF